MTAELELGQGESLMAEGPELIFRQITRHLIDESGQVVTHAFTGTAAEGRPSYARSTVVTAQDSRDWYTARGNSPSLRVMALTVEEVVTAGRRVVDDSEAPLGVDEVRAPGHCFVDARVANRTALKSLRAELWQAAMARGEVPTREPLNDGELDLESLGEEADADIADAV